PVDEFRQPPPLELAMHGYAWLAGRLLALRLHAGDVADLRVLDRRATRHLDGPEGRRPGLARDLDPRDVSDPRTLDGEAVSHREPRGRALALGEAAAQRTGAQRLRQRSQQEVAVVLPAFVGELVALPANEGGEVVGELRIARDRRAAEEHGHDQDRTGERGDDLEAHEVARVVDTSLALCAPGGEPARPHQHERALTGRQGPVDGYGEVLPRL